MTKASAQKIRRIEGTAIPLRGDDIDTDRIIPARFLRCVTFEGLGEHAFEDDREGAGGAHPFDQPRFAGAKILVVNRNFGCGSSREHAPQSLMRWGIAGVVGVSFAEIFFGNCVALGLPCLTLNDADVAAIQSAVEQDPAIPLVLDLEAGRVTAGSTGYPARMPEGVRTSFIAGTWDATGLLLADTEKIGAVERRLPYVRGFA
jgi:3-isopropylmalate/(R)-2-methylmalate dehydratase small subunit